MAAAVARAVALAEGERTKILEEAVVLLGRVMRAAMAELLEVVVVAVLEVLAAHHRIQVRVG